MSWNALAERERTRYADGERRLPDEPDARQRQLVRMAMAAGGVGLASLMAGRADDAVEWFRRSAERYRESWADAPAESWGRLVGAVKARVLAGDWDAAETDADWALGERPASSMSPIGRYAATLSLLVRGDDVEAARLAESLLSEPDSSFPHPVGAALAGLAACDAEAYGRAARAVLESFEAREAFLEDVPVADTVIVLEALAARRGIAAGLESPLLPGGRG